MLGAECHPSASHVQVRRMVRSRFNGAHLRPIMSPSPSTTLVPLRHRVYAGNFLACWLVDLYEYWGVFLSNLIDGVTFNLSGTGTRNRPSGEIPGFR